MKTVIRNSYSPKSGDYCETIVIDEETNKKYLFDCDGVWTLLDGSIDEEEILRKAAEYTDQEVSEEAGLREDADGELQDAIDDEADARAIADQEIWDEIVAIEAASDVVDLVGTYADLQNYDTSSLKDNDVIKVLQDETHNDAITYYRWDAETQTFTYIGAEGPYYTTAETDALLNGKQDTLTAGSNIQINNNIISATDTTYSAGSGITIDANNAISADNQLPNLELYAYFNGINPEVFQYNNNKLPIYFGGNIYWDSVNGYINAAGTTYTAGANIQISNQNVISATDTTYGVFDTQNAGLVPASTGTSTDVVLAESGWQPLSHGVLRFQLPDGSEYVWTENSYETSATIVLPAGAEVYYLSTLTPGTYQFGIVTKYGTAVTGSDLFMAIQSQVIILEYNGTLYTIGSARQTVNGYAFVIQDITSTDQDAYILEITNSTYGFDTITKVSSQYTLPTASASTLGGVKVGSNLSIDANGVLSATVPATNNISQADWTALWQ